MFCCKCGKKSKDGANFCHECGNKTHRSENKQKTKKISIGYKFTINGLFSGRLDRLNFIYGSILIITILAFLGNLEYKISDTAYLIIFFCFMVPLLVLFISLIIRRLHDVNKSGIKLFWVILGFVIPILLIYQIIILFKQPLKNELGNFEKNIYGEVIKKRKFLEALFNLKRIAVNLSSMES